MFEQAAIRVARQAEFAQLKDAIDRVFMPPTIEKYLRELKRKNLTVRDFDSVLRWDLIDRADRILAGSGKKAKQLYESLPLSDQGLIREFYLVRLEQVDGNWRGKFGQVYRVV